MKESALAETGTAFLVAARCGFASFAVAGGITAAGCSSAGVTWCEFSDGHTTPNFAGEALRDFFSQF